MWWGLVPIGFGCWVPLVAGLKAKKREWIAWGVFIVLFTILAFVVSEVEGDEANLGGGLLVVSWILHGATSWALMKPYKQRMTVRARYDAQVEEAEHLDEERRAVIALARKDPARALELGVGRPDVPGSRHGYVVDVNHAPAGVVATLPGVNNDLAAEIVRLRGELNGFDSVDDLGSLLDLHPRVVAAMRLRAVAL
jgi:DNA uptake protein ComE-like DNA-binding protein